MKTGITIYFLFGLGLIFLLGCDSENDDVLAVPGDYFPLGVEHRWEYARQNIYRDPDYLYNDTLRIQVADEILDWSERSFSQLVDQFGFIYKLIRKDGMKYYEQPAYSWEINFLDASVPRHGSWLVYEYDSLYGTKYTMLSVNKRKEVNETVYLHVIEVRIMHEYLDSENHKHTNSTTLYYAKDVGLIYSRDSYDGLITGSISLIKHSTL